MRRNSKNVLVKKAARKKTSAKTGMNPVIDPRHVIKLELENKAEIELCDWGSHIKVVCPKRVNVNLFTKPNGRTVILIEKADQEEDGDLNKGPGCLAPPGVCRECEGKCSEGSDYCDHCYDTIIAPLSLVGRTVRLKGKKRTAKIELKLDNPGGVRLDRRLGGFCCWNMKDLEIV
jgi:hypothetical protein